MPYPPFRGLIVEISNEAYRKIEEMISSDKSPVGIDAKKTHVLILHQLRVIEERLGLIEASLKSG